MSRRFAEFQEHSHSEAVSKTSLFYEGLTLCAFLQLDRAQSSLAERCTGGCPEDRRGDFKSQSPCLGLSGPDLISRVQFKF